MSVPPFDVSKPKSLAQDAALALDVLKRFSDGPGQFTPGDARRISATIEQLFAAINTPDPQRYAMGLVAEEAGEVLQLLGKALRFGLDAPRKDGACARSLLPIETGDLKAALQFGELANLWNGEDADTRAQIKLRKLLNPASVDDEGRRLAPDLGLPGRIAWSQIGGPGCACPAPWRPEDDPCPIHGEEA